MTNSNTPCWPRWPPASSPPGPGRHQRRRGQGPRHHTDRRRRREGRQQGRHDPRLHRRPDHAAGRLQGRRRHAPEPVRQREAAAGDRRQEHGAARRQADRRHQGADAEVSELPRSTSTRPSAASPSRSGWPTTPPSSRVTRQDHQRRPLDRRRHAGFPFPIPKTGYEAMWNHLVRFNGQAYEAKYRNLTSTPAAAPRWPPKASSVQEYPYWDNSKTERRAPTGASS